MQKPKFIDPIRLYICIYIYIYITVIDFKCISAHAQDYLLVKIKIKEAS